MLLDGYPCRFRVPKSLFRAGLYGYPSNRQFKMGRRKMKDDRGKDSPIPNAPVNADGAFFDCNVPAATGRRPCCDRSHKYVAGAGRLDVLVVRLRVLFSSFQLEWQ